MPGLSLFHPPINRASPLDSPTSEVEVKSKLTWTPYDDRRHSQESFHLFTRLPIELQLHIWKAAAEGWIADQESPCLLDNVVYANPLRIRMKLPGLPPVFHVCSVSREMAYDALRDICLQENVKRVKDDKKIRRFLEVYRKTNINASRESSVHLQKTDARGAKSRITIKTHGMMMLKDFRLEESGRRRTTRESVIEQKG